jgi:hypothetical protein
MHRRLVETEPTGLRLTSLCPISPHAIDPKGAFAAVLQRYEGEQPVDRWHLPDLDFVQLQRECRQKPVENFRRIV